MENGKKTDEGEIKRNKGVRHALPRRMARLGYIGGRGSGGCLEPVLDLSICLRGRRRGFLRLERGLSRN
jgi:hypothetical protein